ncbi:ABC transporter ATP-binding protein [Aeromicrobium sp. Root344]|uniref:alpha/beta fold hydrolase n=1 Tax=Aeromicrobium sp. Root344 TaxID=1736521 RepID=UPI0006FFCA3E|nr:alpha/beta fold hydrolase [Aeromicrobium sp. Root344]KQV74965.1 ABC transporter ATP-binding protein [Aeromicrobium sp. Root344]
MRTSRSVLALAAAALTTAALVAAPTLSAEAATPPATTLHFKVNVGPLGTQVCDIVGDLYLPEGASSTNRVPAILTTNGFGGSKDDQAGIGKAFAARGYAVLSYSGLGFGGSSCKITLDDPDYDGKAASQLVSYLGGKSGIAFTDAAHKTPAPVLDVIRKDTVDHAGHAVANDPRVGMVGGSYGGAIQFAAASLDKRIDTIVPMITWSDLSYSLSPNNTSQTVGVSTSTPGAAKLLWALGFTVSGIQNGVSNGQTNPTRLIGCPNFASFVCPSLVNAAATGTLTPGEVASLRHASATSYISKVKVPTLIFQGQGDTLFNLNEGIANYRALKAQGTPVKMVWTKWGHSESAAPGEIDLGNPDPATQDNTRRVADWFDHYLKDSSVDTGPEFTYFRDWVPYSGIATPAYATATSYPVGAPAKLYLSGKALSSSASGLTAGTQTFLTPVAGIPTSTDPADAFGDVIPLPELDLPGSSAAFTSAALAAPVDVVGSPTLDLKVKAVVAQTTQNVGSPAKLVLFVKIADVDATGKATIVHNLVAPVRVPDVRQAFRVTLPAIAHRFEAGHSLRLIVAGGSTNYRGGLTPNVVTIATGATGQVLTLPVVN